MGRPRKTDRHDDFDPEQADASDSDRESDRETFEQPMFADAAESPLYIPQDEWPEGMALRWVRIEAGNAPDNTNWAKMARIGWSPVPRKLFAKRFPATPMPGVAAAESDEVVIFGGLCLCQRPLHLVKRDKQRQEKATQEAGRTVETYVEGGNSNFPRFNQSSPVQFERGVRNVAFKE